MKNKLISASIATSTISHMAFTASTPVAIYSPEEKLARLSQLEKLAGNDTAEYAYDETLYKKFARTKAAGEISDSQYAIIKERAAQLTTMVYPGDTRLSEREQKEIIVLTIKLWTNDIIGLPTAKGISTPNILDAIEKIMTFLGNKAPCNRLQFCRELVELCINMKTAGMIRFVSEAATLLPALLAGTAHEVSNIKSLATLIQTEKMILEKDIAGQHVAAERLAAEKKETTMDIAETKGSSVNLRNVPLAQRPRIPFKVNSKNILEIIQEITTPGNPYTELDYPGGPLDRDRIGDVGAQLLADALKNENCNITDLNLFRQNISGHGVAPLASALKHKNCKLRVLDISENYLAPHGFQPLGEALIHENCKLEVFIFSYAKSKLHEKDIQLLATTLKHKNCRLTELNLGCAHIKDFGTILLAEALQHKNCMLTNLILFSNKITPSGMTALAEALKNENNKLESLYLHRNPLGGSGAQFLADALRHKNCNLTLLTIDSCQIGKEGSKQILSALKDPSCKIFDYMGPNNDDAELEQLLAHRRLAYEQIHGATQ